MPESAEILARAAELSADASPFVLITVVATAGSTPRNAGAKLIWRPEKGFEGTVGGGQFELLVLEAAQRRFRERSSGVEHFVLAAEAEQCCGGTVDVFFDCHAPSQRVVIFGAGHVSRALVDLLEEAPLEVVVVDDRPDWNSAERFPRARRLATWHEGSGASLEFPGATLACVMTCSHDTDFEIMRTLLGAPRPPAFVGLIGSRSKRACFFRRLGASGVGSDRIEAVHCPIGVGDTGKAPRLVAVSIAAQVLLEAKKLAVL